MKSYYSMTPLSNRTMMTAKELAALSKRDRSILDPKIPFQGQRIREKHCVVRSRGPGNDQGRNFYSFHSRAPLAALRGGARPVARLRERRALPGPWQHSGPLRSAPVRSGPLPAPPPLVAALPIPEPGASLGTGRSRGPRGPEA